MIFLFWIFFQVKNNYGSSFPGCVSMCQLDAACFQRRWWLRNFIYIHLFSSSLFLLPFVKRRFYICLRSAILARSFSFASLPNKHLEKDGDLHTSKHIMYCTRYYTKMSNQVNKNSFEFSLWYQKTSQSWTYTMTFTL